MHFGRYQLERPLGMGGMAEVHLATEEFPFGGTRQVAIKRMRAHLGDHTSFDEGRAMFMSEALLVARLKHPNLVQVFDYGDIGGDLYLAMEFIDGPSLRQLINAARADSQPLPIAAALKIISMVCDGMAYAHALRDADTNTPLNLIHRDLSPDNILISRTTGLARVVDFGIARSKAQLHRTRTGLVKGKVSYMAPEQLRGADIDRRADVFALGLVLYELLTLTHPFDHNTEVKRINALLFDEAPPPTTLRPELPTQLDLVLARALSKDKDQRYGSCTELSRDLERVLADLHARSPAAPAEYGAHELQQLVNQRTPPSRVVDVQAAPTEISGATTQVSRPRLVPPPVPTDDDER